MIGTVEGEQGWLAIHDGSQIDRSSPDKLQVCQCVLGLIHLQIDAGSVALERFQIDTYRASYGFGVRLDIMKRLPMVIGMGFPVNPAKHHEIRRFFFSMGGQF